MLARDGPGRQQTAIISRAGAFRESGALLLEAYGLTRARSRGGAARAARPIDRGISASLSISDFTVQQHLKSVVRTRSASAARRELVAQVFRRSTTGAGQSRRRARIET